MSVRFGIDEFIQKGRVVGDRLGLVTNDSARTCDSSRPSRLALLDKGFNLVQLFSPEHGIRALAPDGASVADGRDPLTELPVVSLYGTGTGLARNALEGIDVVLIDLPDIGARFYTYIWTISHVIDGCAEAGVPIIVLDRPNPIGGDPAMCEGPLLDLDCCESFLGRLDIPIRHGLTVGEFARLWAAERRPDADLRVVPIRGWKRAHQWPDLDLPFVATSPSMPSFDSALLYPGTCLFEATNLSVGRGTDFPFQVIGAPWLRPRDIVAGISTDHVELEEIEFIPELDPWSGRLCQGIKIHVTSRRDVRPVALGLQILSVIAGRTPKEFQWRRYPTMVNPDGRDHFDRLIGRSDIAHKIDRGELSFDTISDLTRVPKWVSRIEEHLLY